MFEDVLTFALCAGADPELWFPAGDPGTPGYERGAAVARGICAVCPVRAVCLELALALGREAREGIWGGLDPDQREVLIRAGARHARVA